MRQVQIKFSSLFIDRVTSEPLPAKLFVQLDYHTRDKKNKFFFAYIDFLIAWNIFKQV